jgi:hypothetical protein
MPSNFDYRAVRRSASRVAGVTLKGQPFYRAGSVTVLENYRGTTLTSVTVLSDASATGKAVARLSGDTAIVLS